MTREDAARILRGVATRFVELGIGYAEASKIMRDAYVDAAMDMTDGNITEAAKSGLVHRNTLHNNLKSRRDNGTL